MDDPASHSSATEKDQHPEHTSQHCSAAVFEVLSATAAASGDQFFSLLTKHLCQALGVHTAYIGEIKSNQLNILSASIGGSDKADFSYRFDHGPLAAMGTEDVIVHSSGVASQFADDRFLHTISAESCVAVVLRGVRGRMRGVLAIADTKPIENPEPMVNALKIFAARAEMEIARKRADASLKVQANILDQIADAVICTDLTGHIKSWNRRAEELFGYPQNEALGQHLDFIFKDSDKHFMGSETLEPLLLHGRYSKEMQLNDRNQKNFDALVAMSLERNERSDVIGIICCCTDISRERKAESYKQSAEQRLAFHLQMTPLAYIEWDLNHTIVAWNPSAMRIFGYSAAAAVDSGAKLLFRGEALVWLNESFEKMFATHEGMQGRVENKKSNGETITCEWVATPLLDANNKVIGWATMARDISNLVEEQRQLRKSRDDATTANKAKDNFIALMSHEIRTPMNSIIGFTDLLLETSEDEDQIDSLRTIRTNSYQLLDIFNNLLHYSRMEAGDVHLHISETDLPLLLQEVKECFQQEADSKGLALSVEIQDDIPEAVFTDYNELRNAVMNIVSNAIKFTRAGEISITLTAKPAEDKWHYMLVVKDTGIGIAKDAQRNLFKIFNQADPTSTRRYGGIGMGLAITQRICHTLGGDICMESETGKGSLFYLFFPFEPVSEDERGKHNARNSTDVASAYPMDILVAESHDAGMKVIQLLLNAMGYSPRCTTNGKDTLDEAQKHPFHLAFICLEGAEPDSVSVIQQLREQTGAYIVAISSFASGEYIDRVKSAGADEHLAKPLSLNTLSKCLYTAARKAEV